jgi:hypothetical protein
MRVTTTLIITFTTNVQNVPFNLGQSPQLLHAKLQECVCVCVCVCVCARACAGRYILRRSLVYLHRLYF